MLSSLLLTWPYSFLTASLYFHGNTFVVLPLANYCVTWPNSTSSSPCLESSSLNWNLGSLLTCRTRAEKAWFWVLSSVFILGLVGTATYKLSHKIQPNHMRARARLSAAEQLGIKPAGVVPANSAAVKLPRLRGQSQDPVAEPHPRDPEPYDMKFKGLQR